MRLFRQRRQQQGNYQQEPLQFCAASEGVFDHGPRALHAADLALLGNGAATAPALRPGGLRLQSVRVKGVWWLGGGDKGIGKMP